jgi:hypothetical protein
LTISIAGSYRFWARRGFDKRPANPWERVLIDEIRIYQAAAPACRSASAMSTSMASSFETHRFAMLLKEKVSDPRGEERLRVSRSMGARKTQQ